MHCQLLDRTPLPLTVRGLRPRDTPSPSDLALTHSSSPHTGLPFHADGGALVEARRTAELWLECSDETSEKAEGRQIGPANPALQHVTCKFGCMGPSKVARHSQFQFQPLLKTSANPSIKYSDTQRGNQSLLLPARSYFSG